MKKTTKLHAAAYTLLILLLIFFAVMWGRSRHRNTILSNTVNSSYDRAFFELTDYVNNIDSLLSKAQMASSPAQLASVSNEIFMQSAAAKACFGQLPQENINLEQTAGFLSQVGDYTYVLSQNMINGTEISEEEYETLDKLNSYASELGKSLNGIEEKLYNGELSFETASADIMTRVSAAGAGILPELENVEKAFDGYPSLIYDGPFSEHIESMEPAMLVDAPEISREAAFDAARRFLGERGEGLEFDYDTNNTKLDVYRFTADDGNGVISVSITKRGGYVLDFIQNRDVNAYNYDIKAATMSALAFLESRGIKDMKESYYEAKDNIATINFAYIENGVKCYTDLIKVKVALDNGEVIGMECNGYLMNHHERDLGDISMSEERALECVSAHLDVTGFGLAVIPKDSLREVLCYEFRGSYMGKNFLVYINAQNGREEDILLLIESDTGILTV